MEKMKKLIKISEILLFCVAFILLDHCSVLAMQSGRNINAAPFIPQQQQQQQQQEQQPRQWQQEQEYANLYGSPPHQYHQHQPIQQIPPQHFEESNFYGMPSSPPQHHLPMQIQQIRPEEHLGHQFPSQYLGGHHQAIPSPPQTFSPTEDFTSPHLMFPLLPAQYEWSEPIRSGHVEEQYQFDKNVVDFAVKSGESSAKDIPIGQEQSRPFNPFFASSSPSNDPLRHLTSLLQSIPQGTSLFSENPASIAGISRHLKEPLNPVRTISPSATNSSRIEPSAGVKEDKTAKFSFGTIEDKMLSSMDIKAPEKPKSRGIPPEFPAKNPSGISTHKRETADVSPVKVIPKYLEAVKKPLAPPSTSNPSVKESQIKPKSPNTVETGKAAIPEENVGIKIEGAPKSKTSDSDDKMSLRKQEISSTAGASSNKPEGASSKNKYSSFKSKGQKKNQGKQKGNTEGQSSTKISTNVAPKGTRATIPAEFLPKNKGKHEKSQDSVNPSDPATNKFTELLTEDEELSESMADKIKLESDSEKEMSGSSSDFSDAQDRGSEDDNFFDALQFFETKDKKKTAKQIVRVKELADAKAIEEFAKKCKQELEDAKGKGKAEETTEQSNKEIEEKSTKNKEKLKAVKERLELHKNVDRSSLAYRKDWIKLQHYQHYNEKNKAINTDSTRVTSEMLQETPVETPVDHHAEIKSLLNILSSDKIKQVSIDENHAKKDIRYLLYTIQVFYEALYKYWHTNYKFHNRVEYLLIGEVFTKIGQFYTNQGTNEEDVKLFEKAKDSFKRSMHILSNVWTIPKYREFMESQVFNKDEGKYKFVKWMETLEQLLDDLKLFNIKIKRFNRSNAKKNGSLDRLKTHFKKSTIQSYFEKILNQKFRTIFGIFYVGMDRQGFGKTVQRKGTLSGLNYLQHWLPDQKAELAHIRKVMWNYFDILDYIKIKEIRADFKTYFQTIMGHPMPEGNYIDDERSGCINKTVYTAVNMIDKLDETITNGNPYKITREIQNALIVYKEHILCANFMLIMLQNMYATLEMETKDKHNVHMTIDERNFWHIVEKDKCIPAEENFKKVENLPEFQEFLADNEMFKNTMDDAMEALNALNTEYNIEDRRKEAMGQCDCCKPEEGYEKDSEEEKEGLEKEQKLEEAHKDKEEGETAEKQDIAKVQEEPIEAAAGGEMVKSEREE